jgi:uncharacterized membrane protein YkoI
MKATRILAAVAFAALPVLASAQSAGKSGNDNNSEAALRAKAKISESTARSIALKLVPNGAIKSMEIEREKGTIVYSFDINVPGKTGIDEVLVSALTGKVLAHDHETPKAEKAEAKQEAKEKAKAGKKK